MKQKRKAFTCIIVLALVLLVGFICMRSTIFASAETVTEESTSITAKNEDAATPYGLITNLSLALNGGDGEVRAVAKNEFTLFPATVYVIVEIYSSDTYQESYTSMTLENRNSISDLDIYKSITATASTNGVEKYWMGRMYFNIDNRGWEEKVTPLILCDANGDFIKQF